MMTPEVLPLPYVWDFCMMDTLGSVVIEICDRRYCLSGNLQMEYRGLYQDKLYAQVVQYSTTSDIFLK